MLLEVQYSGSKKEQMLYIKDKGGQTWCRDEKAPTIPGSDDETSLLHNTAPYEIPTHSYAQVASFSAVSNQKNTGIENKREGSTVRPYPACPSKNLVSIGI